jgi:hypothetical protein
MLITAATHALYVCTQNATKILKNETKIQTLDAKNVCLVWG